MSQPMKILIGYDGSSGAVLDDLKWAGLPSQAQAITMSIAEEWMPAPKSYGMVDVHFKEESPSPAEKALNFSREASQRVKSYFPEWEVSADALIGSPARIILGKADEWRPDLIIVGSGGHSMLGRLLLGSVSQKVLTEAPCSVRVAREHGASVGAPMRLVIAIDSSQGAMLAVNEVGSRNWPAETEVMLINADFHYRPALELQSTGAISQWITDERKRVKEAIEAATRTLETKGLKVFTFIKEGDPKKIICEEAERRVADCIFIGAKKLNLIDRFLLGSVSSAIATRAHCTVEVVRPKS